MKKVLFDLTQRCSWGDKSQFLPWISWYSDQGWTPYILCDNWNNDNFVKENNDITSDNAYKDQQDQWVYFYDPRTEPFDYFLNLICPSINAKFFDKYTNQGNEPIESFDISNNNFDKVINYNIRHSRDIFTNPNVSQIEYKITPKVRSKNFLAIEKELKKTKNILLYFDWNLNFKSGAVSRRHCTPDQFSKIKDIVYNIDNFCVSNPEYRLVVINKIARDLIPTLSSKALDLTYFEKQNLSFPEMLYLVCNNCDVSFGHCNMSLSIWVTLEKNMKHFIFTPSSGQRHFQYHYEGINPGNFELILNSI